MIFLHLSFAFKVRNMQKSKEQLAAEFWERIDTLIGDERPYVWVDKMGITRGTFQSAKTRGTMPLPKTVKAWAELVGCSYKWLLKGEGEAFPVSSQTIQSEPIKIESEGLQITTAIDKNKLQQAFETTEQALNDQHKTMKPEPKAEFITMLYTALIDTEKQKFDKKLLNTAIYLVENELSVQRHIMSPDKKTLLIIAIYTLYIDGASNVEALELSIKNLIRSAA